MQSTAAVSRQKTDAQLRERILELAAQFDVPVTDENLTVRRRGQHTIVDTSYARPVELAPGYTYHWPFDHPRRHDHRRSERLDELSSPK